MIQSNSYRTILRSSSIIGGASVTNILVGLIRNKVAAILLGPGGVGLIGLLLNLIQTASTLAALGFGSAATRQIAEAAAKGDDKDIARVRRAIFWGTLGLAVIGCAVFFLLRNVIAVRLLGDPLRASTIGWLSLGVLLTVASGSQQAVLTGLRRIGDLARVQIGAALLSTVVGVAALIAFGEAGIAIFIIAAPLGTFLLGHLYVRRLRQAVVQPASLHDLAGEWRVMIRLGIAFMVGALVFTIGNLVVRSMIQHKLGAAPLGQFQAAWAISMTYIGFVLAAMGTDYYPRLTGVMDQPALAVRMVNEQTEVALLLAGPVLIGMLATAPWVIRLLYTSEFAPAAEILRWQVIGDILKVASWPLGFILVSAGAGRTFMVTETLAVLIFVIGTYVGLPRSGIVATGHSFALMYALYLPLLLWLGHRRIGMRWTAAVRWQLALLLGMAGVVMAVAERSEIGAGAIGLILAAALALFGLKRLSVMGELVGPGARLASLARKATGRGGV